MPLCLASIINRPALSRTWLTVPGADSREEVNTVWIESTTITFGDIFSTWIRILSSEFSARIKRSRAPTRRRSPLILVWRADSSPDT